MRIQETLPEIKRFLRATKDAFESQTEDNKESAAGYSLTFAVALAKPIEAANVPIIKSYLENLLRAVSAFPTSETLVVDINIIDQGSFEHKIVDNTRTNYETSQALESGKTLKAVGPTTAGQSTTAG